MIGLRRMLARGRAHPVLGPILLLVLVLLLAIVLLHVAHDGNATEIGAMCLALATALALPVLERLRRRFSEPRVAVRGDRGPPWLSERGIAQPAVVAAPRNHPLRR